MRASLIYCRQPDKEGVLCGVHVTPDSPGIAPWAFRSQHGSTPHVGNTSQLSGFSACTTSVLVDIENARELVHAQHPDSAFGFGLVKHELSGDTSHDQLRDDKYVREKYYREMEALALATFPSAKAAFAFDHVRRAARMNSQDDDSTASHTASSATVTATKRARHEAKLALSAPSYMCHSDSTLQSWPARVGELMANGSFEKVKPTGLSVEQGSQLAAAKRIVVVNAWRLLSNFGGEYSTHLALCDASSVNPSTETLPYYFVVDGCQATNYGLRAEHAPRHRWFYYPKLKADEVLMFKAFDSGPAGYTEPLWVFHGAVDDPSARAGTPPRESIEVRVALAFDA